VRAEDDKKKKVGIKGKNLGGESPVPGGRAPDPRP